MSNYTMDWLAARLGTAQPDPTSNYHRPLRLGPFVFYAEAAMVLGIRSEVDADEFPAAGGLISTVLSDEPQGVSFDAADLRRWSGVPVWAETTWADYRIPGRLVGVALDRNRLACLVEHAVGEVLVRPVMLKSGPAVVLYGDDWRAVLMAMLEGAYQAWPEFGVVHSQEAGA